MSELTFSQRLRVVASVTADGGEVTVRLRKDRAVIVADALDAIDGARAAMRDLRRERDAAVAVAVRHGVRAVGLERELAVRDGVYDWAGGLIVALVLSLVALDFWRAVLGVFGW